MQRLCFRVKTWDNQNTVKGSENHGYLEACLWNSRYHSRLKWNDMTCWLISMEQSLSRCLFSLSLLNISSFVGIVKLLGQGVLAVILPLANILRQPFPNHSQLHFLSYQKLAWNASESHDLGSLEVWKGVISEENY